MPRVSKPGVSQKSPGGFSSEAGQGRNHPGLPKGCRLEGMGQVGAGAKVCWSRCAGPDVLGQGSVKVLRATQPSPAQPTPELQCQRVVCPGLFSLKTRTWALELHSGAAGPRGHRRAQRTGGSQCRGPPSTAPTHLGPENKDDIVRGGRARRAGLCVPVSWQHPAGLVSACPDCPDPPPAPPGQLLPHTVSPGAAPLHHPQGISVSGTFS